MKVTVLDEAAAALRAADRNPYSRNMDYIEYPDGSGYEGRFTRCGICTLMKKLGLYDLTPALCHLDDTMSEAGGATRWPPAGRTAIVGIRRRRAESPRRA